MQITEAIRSFFRKDNSIIGRFKVKVAGEEIIEVRITGKTAIHVANLTNRLKESLDVRFKNGQYMTMKDTKEVFKEVDKVFDKVFDQVNRVLRKIFKKVGS